MLRKKALKQKTHELFIKEKQERRQQVKEKVRIEAKEREFKRTLNKANAKKGGASKTDKQKILEQLQDPNLNASKRRFLEDKLK